MKTIPQIFWIIQLIFNLETQTFTRIRTCNGVYLIIRTDTCHIYHLLSSQHEKNKPLISEKLSIFWGMGNAQDFCELILRLSSGYKFDIAYNYKFQ